MNANGRSGEETAESAGDGGFSCLRAAGMDRGVSAGVDDEVAVAAGIVGVANTGGDADCGAGCAFLELGSLSLWDFNCSSLRMRSLLCGKVWG
jgi:hypothetical protein